MASAINSKKQGISVTSRQGRKKAVKQPRLLPRLEPIRESDALTLDALTTHYKCRCGNSAETGIQLDAIVCTRCGSAMKPQPKKEIDPCPETKT